MKRTIFSLILVVFWMILIFYLSHQPATESNRLSKGLATKMVTLVENNSQETNFNIGRFNYKIRKNAHFFIYLVLGILTLNWLNSRNIYGLKAVVLAVLICVLYAISDEIHQLFVPGRGSQVKDVILDTAGAITGILGYKFLSSLRRKPDS